MTAPACGSCGAATGDGAALCQGCTRDLGQALLTAANISGDLDDAVAKRMTRGDRGPRGSENPLPVDLAASEARLDLRVTLVYCVKLLMPVGSVLLLDTPGAAVWLAEHINDARQHPDAARMADEIRRAVHRAVAVVDRRPERVGCGRCDRCGAQSWAEGDEDTAVCERGHTVLNARQRRLSKAREADPLATPAEISAFLGRHGYQVKESTISGWGTAGRIARHPGGFYRLSEALDMAARMGTRRPRVGG